MMPLLIGIVAAWGLLSLIFFAMGCYSDRDDQCRWRWRCVIEGAKWAAEWPFALFGGLCVIGLVYLRERMR